MKYTALFEEQVALTPKDLCHDITSFDDLLKEKLQIKLEGKCSRHGYVISGTLNVLSRSMGVMERGRFTGSILYYIQAEADVLNPPEGEVIEGVVIRKNKMGMYVSYNVKENESQAEALRVIVPRDLHIGSEEFENVEIGERVNVQIKKSRFQINDPYILSVGMFVSSAGKAPAPIREVNGDAIPEAAEEEVEADGEGEEEAEVEAEDEGKEAEEGKEVEEAGEEVEEEGKEAEEVDEGEAEEVAETVPEDEESKE
jgi:DNA-directed RNA polymerase subunit E'/Rpb7